MGTEHPPFPFSHSRPFPQKNELRGRALNVSQGTSRPNNQGTDGNNPFKPCHEQRKDWERDKSPVCTQKAPDSQGSTPQHLRAETQRREQRRKASVTQRAAPCRMRARLCNSPPARGAPPGSFVSPAQLPAPQHGDNPHGHGARSTAQLLHGCRAQLAATGALREQRRDPGEAACTDTPGERAAFLLKITELRAAKPPVSVALSKQKTLCLSRPM